jgi:hypothetical protein
MTPKHITLFQTPAGKWHGTATAPGQKPMTVTDAPTPAHALASLHQDPTPRRTGPPVRRTGPRPRPLPNTGQTTDTPLQTRAALEKATKPFQDAAKAFDLYIRKDWEKYIDQATSGIDYDRRINEATEAQENWDFADSIETLLKTGKPIPWFPQNWFWIAIGLLWMLIGEPKRPVVPNYNNPYDEPDPEPQPGKE